MILDTDAMAQLARDPYDAVVIGSGFGSLFFVERFLERQPKSRILIIERGTHQSHDWQLRNRRNGSVPHTDTFRRDTDHKRWTFTIGWGGGLNCWYANAPRLHPTDFTLNTLYGRAQDWPLSYDDLEPYYTQAEAIMAISGDDGLAAVMPRSAPFPQPAHRSNAVDRLMKAAYPEEHFIMPTARARVATDQRAACCARFTCHLCPVDAKFTANNGFSHLLTDERIDVLLGCEVTHLIHGGGVARGASFVSGGRRHEAKGDLIVLGANGIHSPAILLRSGIDHPLTGRGLHEKLFYHVEVFLDGVDNFDGSTFQTGLNYALHDGAFRKDHSGALLSFENRWPFGLRKETNRWRQLSVIKIQLEELPNDDHRVYLDGDGFPVVHHGPNSDYAHEGGRQAMAKLDRFLSPLPVESITLKKISKTRGHVQGTLRMGKSRADSVVDANQCHHDVRNLLVLGSAVWPSCSMASPSLTVAALSLRAADRLAA